MTDEELNQRFDRIEKKIRSETNALTLFIIVWTVLLGGFACITYALAAR